jgi:hypothetical protein
VIAVSIPDSTPADLLDFRHIYIYDPASRVFHDQIAKADRPSPRIRSCSVGTSGPNGTYEIVVYGGQDARLEAREKMLRVIRFSSLLCLHLPGSRQIIQLSMREKCTPVLSLVGEEVRRL